nr:MULTISPECIES: hypothetical protein [unclassified Enterococcus]
MSELKEAHLASHVPEGTSLTLDMVDEVLARLELRLEELEQEVLETRKVSLNPAKQQQRTLKAQKRKLSERRDKMADRLPKYIVADAGYGSEQNYRYLEDELPNHTTLIPYSTMLKEQSKKWQSDERKVMNWTYIEKEDYYIDPKGVRFKFNAYRTSTDKINGFVRDFKEYKAERYTESNEVIQGALTRGGITRIIKINPSLEYFKAKQRTMLSEPENGKLYA